MNKKYKIIIGGVIILALIAVGYLYFVEKEEAKIGPVPFDSFKKQEINGRTFYENKDVGLTFEVPRGWEAKSDGIASISMVSADFNPFKNNPASASIPEKGCWIGVTARIEKENSNYDIYYSSIKDLIDNESHRNNMISETQKYDIINVNGLQGLKNIVINNKDNPGSILSIQIPANNKIYFFETDLFGQDKDLCSQEFNKFLETVSIKKK